VREREALEWVPHFKREWVEDVGTVESTTFLEVIVCLRGIGFLGIAVYGFEY
jgi:hypothetical protein